MRRPCPLRFVTPGRSCRCSPSPGAPTRGSCTSAFIQQPNFANAVAKNNVRFRIPTPLFGLGLIENIDDSALQTVLVQHYTGPY